MQERLASTEQPKQPGFWGRLTKFLKSEWVLLPAGVLLFPSHPLLVSAFGAGYLLKNS